MSKIEWKKNLNDEYEKLMHDAFWLSLVNHSTMPICKGQEQLNFNTKFVENAYEIMCFLQKKQRKDDLQRLYERVQKSLLAKDEIKEFYFNPFNNEDYTHEFALLQLKHGEQVHKIANDFNEKIKIRFPGLVKGQIR